MRKYVRKMSVTGPGRSYYLVLPREMIKDLNWKKGEKKVISQEGSKVVIEDWKEGVKYD